MCKLIRQEAKTRHDKKPSKGDLMLATACLFFYIKLKSSMKKPSAVDLIILFMSFNIN